MKNISEQIEKIYADKAGKTTTSRKCIADYWEDNNHYDGKVAVNVKSNDINKQNFLPRLVSCRPAYDFLLDQRNELKFIFVDYQNVNGNLTIVDDSNPISIEEIDWKYMSIQCQGDGFLALNTKTLNQGANMNRWQILRDKKPSRDEWLEEFRGHYINYIHKENLKLQRNLQYFSVGCQQLDKAKQVMEELVA